MIETNIPISVKKLWRNLLCFISSLKYTRHFIILSSMYKFFRTAFLFTIFLGMTPLWAAIDDTQILDQENKTSWDSLSFQTFSSCDAMDKVLGEYFKKSFINNATESSFAESSFTDGWIASKDTLMAQLPQWGLGGWGENYSATNIQVAGIDESDIVKTDGSYIYYAPNYISNDGYQYVTVTRAWGKDSEIVKRIKLPNNYSNIQLYTSGKKLVILANKWEDNYIYSSAPINFNNNTKTVVVVYDVSNMSALKLDRFYVVSGNPSESRVENGVLYIASQNWVGINYWGPYGWVLSEDEVVSYFDTKFHVSNTLPRTVEINHTSDVSKQITANGKKIPYSLTQNQINCNSVEYILPENPQNFSYVTFSIIPLESKEDVTTKVLYWDVSEFYMTHGSLYVIGNYWKQNTGSPCPLWARCLVPDFISQQNSLIHRFSTDNHNLKYEYSTIVPGMPLSQYALHEKDGVLLTANQKDWSNGVDIFAIDSTGKLLSKLENVGAGERFQAARYIWDRLYLVTFEQIDPLFVIDTKNPQKLSVLGELEIPGYSLYLHPYDATHLIGMGYDTLPNQWGGTMNWGIKFDLYDVSDVNKPKQQFTLTIGGVGSSSEAFWNPRMIVWDADKKLLTIPAQLMNQNTVTWQSTYAWQWALVVSIDANKGISETGRITHIDTSSIAEQRKKACEQYTTVTTETKCYTLITTGEKVCIEPENNPENSTIPSYCFSEYDDSSYLASTIWNYYPFFIQRVVYIGSSLYTFSPAIVQSNTYGGKYTQESQLKNIYIDNPVYPVSY